MTTHLHEPSHDALALTTSWPCTGPSFHLSALLTPPLFTHLSIQTHGAAAAPLLGAEPPAAFEPAMSSATPAQRRSLGAAHTTQTQPRLELFSYSPTLPAQPSSRFLDGRQGWTPPLLIMNYRTCLGLAPARTHMHDVAWRPRTRVARASHRLADHPSPGRPSSSQMATPRFSTDSSGIALNT